MFLCWVSPLECAFRDQAGSKLSLLWTESKVETYGPALVLCHFNGYQNSKNILLAAKGQDCCRQFSWKV